MDTQKLTPILCFTIGLIHIASADGIFQKEEDLYIASAITGHEESLEAAIAYFNTMQVDQFLREANNILNYEQKLSMLINMLDLLYSDGNVDMEERKLFSRYMQAFGIEQETMNGHLKTIILKNERDIFEMASS